MTVGDRTGEQTVVHHQPPSHFEVRERVEELFAWIERVSWHPKYDQTGVADEWVHPALMAAIAQHRLVWIHPFVDGNGRTARMFTTLLLYSRGYDFKYLFNLSAFYDSNRDAYYNALREADRTTRDSEADYTGWLEYCVGGFSKQMFELRRAVHGFSLPTA